MQMQGDPEKGIASDAPAVIPTSDDSHHPLGSSSPSNSNTSAHDEAGSSSPSKGTSTSGPAVATALPAGGEKSDVIWVEFDEDDPECPFNFSYTRKWVTTIMAIIFTAEVAATAGAYVPGIPSMERDLGYTNHEISLLGISIYALGFGIFPLVLAPFSEVYGRNLLYIVTHLAYTLLFLGTGFANNITAMIILRFIQGGFGSTGSTMVGGTIADIWRTNERGLPMSLFALSAIFGTGFGPFFAGFVAGNPALEWRWIQFIQAIYTGALFIPLLLLLKETRGSVLLTRRAIRLRKDTGDSRYQARAEAERASVVVLIKHSLTRPIWMLFSEPIVFVFSLWVAFAWGFMYMLLTSIGLVSELHDYTPGQTGLVFLSICGGAVVGFLLSFPQDAYYKRKFAVKGPEARLYSACIAAVMFPAGCFIYAWTSYPDVSIAGPIVGIVTLMAAIFTIYLAVFNYLADSYLIYASSALAGQSFARNMFGFAFPLFVEKMYRNLGYQWASSLAGFLAALLGVVPFVLLAYGHKIRAKSKFSLELQRLHKQ